MRVQSYQRLKNFVLLVAVAAYFAATFLGQKLMLKIRWEKMLIISQLSYGIPFRFYELADGIKEILSRSTPTPPADPRLKLQLELLLGLET